MPKFIDKKTGSIHYTDYIAPAGKSFCGDRTSCENCPILAERTCQGWTGTCRDWVNSHPYRAAELMGYAVDEKYPKANPYLELEAKRKAAYLDNALRISRTKAAEERSRGVNVPDNNLIDLNAIKRAEINERCIILKNMIEAAAEIAGLNICVYDGKIGFVDQEKWRIVAVWEPQYHAPHEEES